MLVPSSALSQTCVVRGHCVKPDAQGRSLSVLVHRRIGRRIDATLHSGAQRARARGHTGRLGEAIGRAWYGPGHLTDHPLAWRDEPLHGDRHAARALPPGLETTRVVREEER